jgi:hypothetical protein
MQQIEQQNPRVNPGNSGARVSEPETPPSPSSPPQQRNYAAPQNETPPSESRPNYSQPPVERQQKPERTAATDGVFAFETPPPLATSARGHHTSAI